MPRATDTTKASLAKILIYGDVKTKKTWWALRAAEAGFNVTLLDGDNGHHIIAKQSDDAKRRIAYVPLVDSPDEAFFHNFIGRMYKNKGWGTNEETRKSMSAMNVKQWQKGTNDGTEHSMYFDPTKLNSNDVLIIDSWSAFCRSMARHFAIQNDKNVIPTGVASYEKGQVDVGRQSWEDYGWGKDVTQKVLSMFQALPCHIVVVAHSTEHTVYADTTDSKGKKVQEIKSQTLQPLGYSGAQGRILGQFFSDILYTYIDKVGSYRVSTKPEFDVVGGSRILDPKTYTWKELTWERLVEESRGMYRLPENRDHDYNSEAFEFLEPGELPTVLTKEKRANALATEKLDEVPNSITENADGKKVSRMTSSRLRKPDTVITSKI